MHTYKQLPVRLAQMILSCALLSSQATDVCAVEPVTPRTPEVAVTPSMGHKRRHNEFLNRIKSGPVGLLFIGDSITDSWPRIGELSWLRFAQYNPANFGVSGETTEHVLWRLQNGELEGISPRVAVIMIGTNNIGRCPDEQPEWAAAGITKIVELVKEKLPNTKILLLAVFPRDTPSDPKRLKVEEINKIITKLDDGKRVRYLDIGSKFLDGKGEIPRNLMADRLHPSAQGYEVWYAAMMPTLGQMMESPR